MELLYIRTMHVCWKHSYQYQYKQGACSPYWSTGLKPGLFRKCNMCNAKTSREVGQKYSKTSNPPSEDFRGRVLQLMSAPAYVPTQEYAVSSAMKGLTSGFGMEPGVPPSLWTPTNSNPLRICSRREAIRGSLEILKGCFRVPVPGQRLLFRQGGFLKHSLAIVGRKGR